MDALEEGAIKKERGTAKLQPGVDQGNPRYLRRHTDRRVIRSFS